MESISLQRGEILTSLLPLRPLLPESPQPTIGQLPPAVPEMKADGRARPKKNPLQPLSPMSDRSGSSFSFESAADSWVNVSTERTPPQTPRPEHELDDTTQLDSVSHRGDALKRKCDSIDDGSKKVKLPSFKLPGICSLLPSTKHEDRRATSCYGPRNALRTPHSSPEPETDYVLSPEPAVPAPGDPIVQWLNSKRKEAGGVKSILSLPEGLGEVSLNIHLDFPKSQPIFYREKQQYTPQSRSHCQRPRHSSLPPKKIVKGRGSNGKGHNNIKYSLEEADYIRFNRYEAKLPWEENKRLFRKKFPMEQPDKDREKQGIQGVHYRDNKHVPHLTDRGRKLVFLPNGHVKPIMAMVRDQKELRPYFGLVYLYPERALLYDWVPDKFKQIAAELVKERTVQKEEERNKAIARGEWVEKLEPGICACCYKPDRERDIHKRAPRGRPAYPGRLTLPDKARQTCL